MIQIDSNAGTIGNIHWHNSDTRRLCSYLESWGDTWWATPYYEPSCGTSGFLLQNPPWAGGDVQP